MTSFAKRWLKRIYFSSSLWGQPPAKKKHIPAGKHLLEFHITHAAFLISLKHLLFAWKAITFTCSVSTWRCLERCRIIFAFGNPLSVQHLSFNNVCFIGGKSLFGILRTRWQWLLWVAETTAISTLIILVHDYYSRLCSLQRRLEDRGKWFTSHPRSEIHGGENTFHLSACPLVGARKQDGCRSCVKSIILGGGRP